MVFLTLFSTGGRTVNKLIIAIISILILVPLIASAASTPADSIQVYGFASNTSTFADDNGAYQWDWSRFGFRAYTGDHVMVRMEYDVSSNAMKYSYMELMTKKGSWKLGAQYGRWLIPCMYNWPGPSSLPMTRWSYSQSDLSVYGTGLSAYAKTGNFKLQAGNFNNGDSYTANLGYGPINAWWTQDEGQGLFFKETFHPWINLFVGWTNYEDRPGRDFPERRNSAFIQNHVRLGDQIRVYTHYDLGDHRGAFIGGVSYMLFSGDVENTIGVFYDSNELWQARVAFSFNQVLR